MVIKREKIADNIIEVLNFIVRDGGGKWDEVMVRFRGVAEAFCVPTHFFKPKSSNLFILKYRLR